MQQETYLLVSSGKKFLGMRCIKNYTGCYFVVRGKHLGNWGHLISSVAQIPLVEVEVRFSTVACMLSPTSKLCIRLGQVRCDEQPPTQNPTLPYPDTLPWAPWLLLSRSHWHRLCVFLRIIIALCTFSMRFTLNPSKWCFRACIQSKHQILSSAFSFGF
jgi:hypothetical protein